MFSTNLVFSLMFCPSKQRIFSERHCKWSFVLNDVKLVLGRTSAALESWENGDVPVPDATFSVSLALFVIVNFSTRCYKCDLILCKLIPEYARNLHLLSLYL